MWQHQPKPAASLSQQLGDVETTQASPPEIPGGERRLFSQITAPGLFLGSPVHGAMGKELGAGLVCWGCGFRNHYGGGKTT